jgi:hypothetical protein
MAARVRKTATSAHSLRATQLISVGHVVQPPGAYVVVLAMAHAAHSDC